MAKQTRRDFLKFSAISAAALAGVKPLKANNGEDSGLSDERMGVLVDTTVCIGCRKCEWACKTAHNLPTDPLETYDDKSVFATMRRPSPGSLTVVNRFENEKTKQPINVKVQCMHCNEPACVSACIVGAFSKQQNGSVIWDTDKCIGCRYCIVACPFQVPAFEFDKALRPDITKCDFCFSRTAEGKLPACVEMCPMEAITYGNRQQLLEVAKKRIALFPDRYKNHILGENEVGGTSWMYLSSVEFSELKFPKLPNNPAPGVSEAIQHGIFRYFVPPISLFAILGGIMWLNKNKSHSEDE